MNDLFSQFALIDALLSNWGGIRVRIGPVPASLESELARIGAGLAVAESPDRIAVLIDDLLDLTLETAAHAYVRELLARTRQAAPQGLTTRGAVIDASATDESLAADVAYASRRTGQAMGNAVATKTEPVPIAVYYATNRERAEASGSVEPAEIAYGGEPSKKLSFGRVTVTIPVAEHKLGAIERRPWWLCWRDKDDPQCFVVLGQHDVYAGVSDFAGQLEVDLRQARCDELLVFMHGYKVTFEAAAQRAAQLALDLQFPGAVVLFSWPSLGAFLGYFADEDRAAASAELLASFLRDIEGGPWKRVHLVAHSMGNRVLVSALAGPRPPRLPMGSVALAAADVYCDLFEQQFPTIKDALAGRSGQITSYASKTDLALFVSSWFHRAERIGYVRDEPFVMDGLETIDATNVDTSFLGHSYFGDERSMLTDLRDLLAKGLPAQRRPGLAPAPTGKEYWMFPR